MKKVRSTTKEERMTFPIYTEIVMGKRYYFEVCDWCRIAYFPGDTILLSRLGNREDTVCPNIIKRFFRPNIQCKKSMTHGDENDFNKYYKIV